MKTVYKHYREGLTFRRHSENWSDEQKSEWTLRKLKLVVSNAAVTTEYYRDRLRSSGIDCSGNFSFADFAKFPILSREDIRESITKMISKEVPAEEIVSNATGGSTGTPTEIRMGPVERGWVESGIEFALERVGVPAGSRIGYLWGHHLDPQLKPGFSERIRAWGLNYRFFDCFRLSEDVFAGYHEEFEAYRPDCIVAYASALGHFANYLKERNVRPPKYPRVCFVTGAEKLHEEQRSVIEEVFGRPVYERYGGRDFGPAAIQTHPIESRAFSVDWSWCLLEPETADPNSPILITKLHADAMPMIRYRVGDVGRFEVDARPGYPTFELAEVIGRQTARIRRMDGSWLHGNHIPHLLKGYPVREFMLVQEMDLSMELKIVRGKEFDENDSQKIFDTITANAGGLPLRIAYVESIERGPANKWTPVISKAG